MRKFIWAPNIVVLFLFFNISYGNFGDVISLIQLGTDNYGNFKYPVSICYGNSSLYILESKVIDTEYPWYMNVRRFEFTTGGNDIVYKDSYKLTNHRNDSDGFCYVTENNVGYIWSTKPNQEANEPQLWQLRIGAIDDYLEQYRTLYLPSSYYPTGITLDTNLNIYFIDGISRKVYKINYNVYSGSTGVIYISSLAINYLFTIPRAPSIPMGIVIDGLNFYITLAGENDYIIKTDMFGNEVAYKDLHDYINSEHISRMPTDLTIDGGGYIWYTDCDYDKLYKIQK